MKERESAEKRERGMEGWRMYMMRERRALGLYAVIAEDDGFAAVAGPARRAARELFAARVALLAPPLLRLPSFTHRLHPAKITLIVLLIIVVLAVSLALVVARIFLFATR
jgi:hypothetical protein